MYDLIVIGGGAAGVFAAIEAKSSDPGNKVLLLERGAHLLTKVKISGGGRCNVTHACFDVPLLIQNYPRGSKELKGPFSRFQPKDTVKWFKDRGVDLKVEADNRMFPITDDSQTIIDALLKRAEECGVLIYVKQKVNAILKTKQGFSVGPYLAKRVLIATGSAPLGHKFATDLGHTIAAPVPSLFTFNCPTSFLKELSGIAIDPVEVKVVGTKLKERGPLLITHFGFSGPAILKLSAWGARVLAERKYDFEISINWLPKLSHEEVLEIFLEAKKNHPRKLIGSEPLVSLPKKFLKALSEEKPLQAYSTKELRKLAIKLQNDTYHIQGKTTHKEEFVTCGGVVLKEINFQTMESKICPGLYFAGEVLDIDGVTGGFNFQNAWTTGYLVGQACKNRS